MMEILDVIRQLSNLERYANACRHDAESCGDPLAVAGIYQHDAEAIQTAITVLEGLERNKDKAANIIKAMRICYAPGPLEKCQKCPYCDDDCQSHGSKQDKDIVDLIMQVYLQGGETNETY